MTKPTALHTGPPIAWPTGGHNATQADARYLRQPPTEEPTMTTECPRSFTHDEAEDVWQQLQEALGRIELTEHRAERAEADRDRLSERLTEVKTERDAARAEVERMTGELNILKARQPDSLVAAVRAERDAAITERDTARRAHEEALERIVTLSQEVADAHKERLRAIANSDRLTEALHHERCNTRYSKADRDEDRTKRETLKADLANAREAAASDHAAMMEARAERDTLARALVAVRAVVAMVGTGDEA